ncbi:autotransporter outer membrane beta-barrel domain-containing protein [Tunturiibacter lichenicola]|uniref:hypothetical protein n=1 Tax=Tunturiibacter lichenicola TaxID=2051959 RepID=UPI0021B2FA0F|nr:hypothetical protein [Edaphobacter lichenicola]
MKIRHMFNLACLTSLASLLTACSGGSSSPPTPPAISVAFASPAPTTLAASATATLTATVTNDSANAGVTWSATCSTSPCGTFSSASTASGAPTTYQAPAAAGTVTVVATSVTDKTKSVQATITITAAPPAPIQVALTPAPPKTLLLASTLSLVAVVTNDSANAGVTWSVTCGSSPCGSFNPAATASNAATTYTAPTAIPTNNTVTVIATSVTDKTKSASATITITNILSDGTYVFHVSGDDANSQYFLAGAFSVKGGLITGGEQDFLDSTFGQNDQLSASGSSLAFTADGNIQITLNTGDATIGVNGIETFNGSAVSPSRLLISESDNFASGGGSVDLQTTVATPAGGYAFAVLGADNQNPQQPLGVGGILRFNGTSLDTSANSVFDCNDSGVPALGQAFTGGSVTAPDGFGRVTITLNPSSACTLMQMVFGGYIIGPNQIQLVEASGDTFNGTLGGMALGQGTHAGQFNTNSVANTAYVFSSFGADANGVVTIAGGFIFNTTGPLSGDLSINDLNAFGGNTINGGSFAVDPTGRVTLTNVATSGNANTNPLTLQFQLYLDGNGNALELGVDNVQVTSGMSYLQTTGNFPGPGNSVMLAQGFVPVSTTSLANWSAAGPITLTTSTFAGFVDYNVQGGPQTPNQPVNATLNTTNGSFTLGGLDPNFATDGFGYYPIDASRVLGIEIDDNQLGLLQIEGIPTN